MNDNSILAYAVLGLLQQQPRSGYDLRKIFANTPMRTFTDSPGAIYPALQRLEKRGLVRSHVQETSGLRRRRLFRPTVAGTVVLKNWQRRLITRDDVVNHVDELMLRFSFMDETVGARRAAQFLNALAAELASYIPTLRQFLKAQAQHMPLSGRLALESGIRSYETLLRWSRNSIKIYKKRKKGETRS